MRHPSNVIAVHAAPRSGSSWIGQIFKSSPQVAFRFQPLYSFAFKDRLGDRSTKAEIEAFLDDLYRTEHSYVMQSADLHIVRWGYPQFEEPASPTHLVYKDVRFHHVVENLLAVHPAIKVVGIVRHPCAVINSWLRAPSEFRPGWDVASQWRLGQNKNQNRPEEFFGFERWKEVARLFLTLRDRYPTRFYLLEYDKLNNNALQTVGELFAFCGLPLEARTREFLEQSTTTAHASENSVFRQNQDNRKWVSQLDAKIAAQILREVRDTPLEVFLDPEDLAS